MRFTSSLAAGVAVLATGALACDSCYGPVNHVEHVRRVKRMQPGAPNATYGPTRQLEWGQINFLHTTDTHGWLSGHLKEQNYGADWGDFKSLVKGFKHLAKKREVDLLLIDTGDLHDGTGLTDAYTPDGEKVLPIFDDVDYDLLTIGNHELYVSEVAFQVFNKFAKTWGEKYVTSNVKIYNNATKQYEYPGVQYRYWTTPQGLRLLAFGVLFDFTGNSNASQVIKAKDMVKQQWFTDALNLKQPIDMFILFGHNAARRNDSSSTMGIVWDAIRAVHPTKPIQVFGGHTHVRDFQVYDANSVGIESGRYCETLGWVSMSGFTSCNSGHHGKANPHGVPNPSRKATNASTSPFVYARRYLDWNRYTFLYHTTGKEDAKTFDAQGGGVATSQAITTLRTELNLGQVYGCAPASYCVSCAPFNDSRNIFPGVVEPAVKAVVINPARADKARVILGNTGAIRFDLYKGPFTYDDNFIVSPFRDVFLYIPDVPYAKAKTLLNQLNAGIVNKRAEHPDFASMRLPARDICVDPVAGPVGHEHRRDLGGVTRRQVVETPGYTTKDDFGTDGDDTAHTKIPNYSIPPYWQAQVNFPNGTDPTTVDVVFFDFIEKLILQYLGTGYTDANVTPYINANFTSQDFMLPYAKLAWQANMPNCPI